MGILNRSIYFNYAGVAPISLGTIGHLCRFLFHFYCLGPRSALLKYDKYNELLAQEVSRFVNCDPTEVSFLKNTTEGVIIAAESLPLEAGDEVLVLECEYPANLIPWMKKRLDGVKVRVIEGKDTCVAFQSLMNAISERTKAIAISWVQYSDGLQIDLEKLSRVCRERGIFLVVDGVQIAGTRAVDFKNLPMDFLICGGHKHIQAGPGSGFIVIRKDVLPRLKPFKVGIRSVKWFKSSGFELKDTSSRFEDGTLNLLGLVALYNRLREFNRIGIQKIEAKSKALLEYYKAVLREKNVDFIDHPRQGNLISIFVDDALKVTQFLEKNKIFARKISEKLIRISFSPENKKQDIHQFVRILKQYIRQRENEGTSESVLHSSKV